METTAIYPGTFDLPTLAHLSLTRRAVAYVDDIVVLVQTLKCPTRLNKARRAPVLTAYPDRPTHPQHPRNFVTAWASSVYNEQDDSTPPRVTHEYGSKRSKY